MAKIGYIMAAAHYDKLEEDRQWMQEYGCVKIVEENDADETCHQQIQQCTSWRTRTGNVPGILPSEGHKGYQHT